MEKLYYYDAYLKSFSARVIKICEEGVVLDKTAFFPEGGGQSSDKGYIGGAFIYDVKEIDGTIYHKTKDEINFSVGDTVKGEIDFEKRFSDMQNHSGEHIISGLVHNIFGFENVGFHLNDNEIALDFSGIVPSEKIDEIELLANKVIWSNIEINAFFPGKDEIKNFSYRSKKEIEGDLRLVEISGVDVCACCAPHVRRTGEIGIIKIVGAEKHRGGTRMYILSGFRALKDYSIKQKENKAVGNLLKVKEYETSQAVSSLLKKKNDIEFELSNAYNENAKKSALSYSEAEVIVAITDFKDRALTFFANGLSEKAGRLAAAFSKDKQNAYRYMIISKKDNISELLKEMNIALHGRGGGNGLSAQGTVNCTEEEINSFFKKLK